MTKSRIQVLKAQAIAAGKKLNIGITAQGWSKLKKAARNNNNLDVEKFFLLLQQKDIEKMWTDMSPEKQAEVTANLLQKKAEREAAEQEAALKLKEEEEILNESIGTRKGRISVTEENPCQGPSRRRTYKE